MDFSHMKAIIEGLLFVSGDEGLDAKQIARILEIDQDTTLKLIYELQDTFRREGRGIQIIEVAKSFQLSTLPVHAPYYERLAQSPQQSTLSQAALETLAIVAYKQPITRVLIEEIRGVKSEKALNTLMMKGLVKELGRAESTGRPILYGTTDDFLHHFGLNSLNDLPPLPEGVGADDIKGEDRSLFVLPEANNLEEPINS